MILKKKNQTFFNEKKIGLKTTLTDSTKNISINKTSYFEHFLSNVLTSYIIEDYINKERPKLIYKGSENFPYCKITNQIKEIQTTNLSNVIGISSLGFTKDKKNCNLETKY